MIKVLIVDDSQVIREAVCKLLIEEGHEARSVQSGREGIELFQSARFDLALIDVVLPDISGMDVLAAIRRVNREIPVIMMSATFNPVNFKETSNTAFVSKTGGINRLIETIRIYLPSRPVHAADSFSRGFLFRSIFGRLKAVAGHPVL